MIYLIRAVGTQFVKIGVAKNPINRLQALQVGMPMRLVLWATADWNHDYERRFHGLLRDRHAHGEWYLVDSRIERLAASMQAGDSTPIAWIDQLRAKPRRLAKVIDMAR